MGTRLRCKSRKTLEQEKTKRYRAFQSLLCEVCLTDKRLSKTTSNKESVSSHRLEKRFCYFAKLCLIRMVIKLK